MRCPDGSHNELSGFYYTIDDCKLCAVGQWSVGGDPCVPCPEASTSIEGSSSCSLW
jgi:hypothetical protein